MRWQTPFHVCLRASRREQLIRAPVTAGTFQTRIKIDYRFLSAIQTPPEGKHFSQRLLNSLKAILGDVRDGRAQVEHPAPTDRGGIVHDFMRRHDNSRATEKVGGTRQLAGRASDGGQGRGAAGPVMQHTVSAAVSMTCPPPVQETTLQVHKNTQVNQQNTTAIQGFGIVACQSLRHIWRIRN
ncbi:hypothetical protein J6590_102495 [Homalodisca vitripennis]|nr:hypothetical protein J6590_102495 [Homalodisca vitripennis]